MTELAPRRKGKTREAPHSASMHPKNVTALARRFGASSPWNYEQSALVAEGTWPLVMCVQQPELDNDMFYNHPMMSYHWPHVTSEEADLQRNETTWSA